MLVSAVLYCFVAFFFFFNDPATTKIYTLSLHDALPISAIGSPRRSRPRCSGWSSPCCWSWSTPTGQQQGRSEEHTSELQSRPHLVCRLLLEKKKTDHTTNKNKYTNVVAGSFAASLQHDV